MALIAFRRARDAAGRWKDGRLQPEPPPPPPEASADPGAAARSFYESLFAEGGGAEPAPEPPRPAHFCRSCGASFRDPPARHRRSTAHLLGLAAAPAPGSGSGWVPGAGSGACSGPGYRLLLRAGWAGGGLGPAGRGRLLPVPTELKRDRAGLGWHRGRNRARVSHFGPGDTAAVAGPERHRERAGFGSAAGPGRGRHRGRHREQNRARCGAEEAARGWEIGLRREWEREEAPESALRHLRGTGSTGTPKTPTGNPPGTD